jgi:hypothetical protein
MSDRELKRSALFLNLCIDWGIDADKDLVIGKDKATFWHSGKEINVPVENIDYDGDDLAFTAETFREDGGIIINTRHTISMFKRSLVKELIANNKQYLRKYNDKVFVFPRKLLTLNNIIHLGVNDEKRKTDTQKS